MTYIIEETRTKEENFPFSKGKGEHGMDEVIIRNLHLTDFQQPNMLPQIIHKFSQEEYYPALEKQIEQNVRAEQRKFEGFTDMEMMYYYVHQRKHIRKNRDRKHNTKIEYLRNLLQFYRYLAESQEFLKEDTKDDSSSSLFRYLRPWHMRHYQEYLQMASLGKGGKPYAAATLDGKLTILKSFLKWLYTSKHTDFPLHEEFLGTSLSEEDIPNRDLYYHEVKQLLDYYHNHPMYHALLTMLAMTGLRVREVAEAKWGNLYLDPLSGHYRLKGVGKRNKPFDKYISPVLFERIVKYRQRRRVNIQINLNDNSPLFPDREGNHYNYKNLSNLISRAIEKSDLPFLSQRKEKVTPHFFRHFYAIYSRQQGADIFLIQKELGHQDRRTTERYLEKVLQREQEIGMLWNEDNF